MSHRCGHAYNIACMLESYLKNTRTVYSIGTTTSLIYTYNIMFYRNYNDIKQYNIKRPPYQDTLEID